ncbi:MAG: alpha/beta hydrolase [Gammaproteobacteria bacterium]|nr:alpha/beta hydrolase [Gammaproteobacteria bacterium]
MPSFQHNNVSFHYEEMGSGEPIIALHGLAQHSAYWMQTGVVEKLSETYRVIALDIRGHGLTQIDGEPKGYDIDTCIEDVNALAAHLGLDQFHLMGHSTGGMIAVRYAMKYAIDPSNIKQNRLLSLILCNTSSSTQFSNLPDSANKIAINMLAGSFETFSWPMIIQGLKLNSGPLFAGIAAAENKDELFKQALHLMEAGNGQSIGAFVRHFYNDSDPRIEGLKQIICPTLVITAELDHIFCKTSQLFLQHIQKVSHTHHPSAGHMTALECPDWLAAEVLGFLRTATS